MKTNKILTALLVGIYLVSLISAASALTVTSVSTSPQEIQPGDRVSIKIDIENNRDDDISDVTVSLLLNGETMQVNGGVVQIPAVPFSPYQSSNSQTFSEIREGKIKSLEFDLESSADAESGTYKIPVKMDYVYDGSPKSESGMVSVTINAKPELSISSDSPLIAGQMNELNVKIINSGLGNAKFLSVKINEAFGTKITGASSFYIGDLNKDDSDSVKINVFINENAGSTISVPIEIIYKDSKNNEFAETETLTAKVYSAEEAVALGLIKKSNTLGIVLAVVIIAVAYVIYRKIKKRMKKNKQAA